MKKWILFASLLLLPLAVVAQNSGQDEDEDGDNDAVAMYIGVDGCKKCHRTTKQGKQFDIWKESAHSGAYETLKSPEAQKIATEKGLTVAAHEAPECLKCHVAGFDVDASMKKARFAMEDGVQCESCHGPGSKYKKKSVMKDRDASIAAGMTAILVADGTAEKQCVTCHNEESPTFKGFNFDEMWEKIAHPVPE